MNRNKCALICNILLVILGGIGLYLACSENNVVEYYTNDSNILCLLSSLLFVIYMIIKKDVGEIPFFASLLRYMATACLTLTFFVVFYLASTAGDTYFEGLLMFFTNGSMLFYHLLCPIISFISFTFFEGDRRLNKKKTIYLAMIPTVVYAIILIILNASNVVEGPYPFLMVNKNPVYISLIWVVVILGLNYLFARFILLFNQKHSPRRKRKEA